MSSVEQKMTGPRPQPAGGVTAVRMRLGRSRREAGALLLAGVRPSQGCHRAWADAAGSVEPAPDTPAQKRVAQGRPERFSRRRRHFVLKAEVNPAGFSVK